MFSDFSRANDFTYKYCYTDQSNNKEKVFFINCKEKVNPEIYAKMKMIGEKLKSDENLPRFFKDSNDHLYKVSPIPDRKRHRFARFLTKFFKFYRNESCRYFEVKKTDSKKSPQVLPLISEIKAENCEQQAFSDGYTFLASEAFQKYEPEFAAHDDKGSLSATDHSQYKIVEANGSLKLIPKETPTPDENVHLKKYLKLMIDQYGLRKIQYILHLYQLNEEDLKGPLTPEIVYRINIGVGNLEKQDLDDFAQKIEDIQNIDRLSDETLIARFTGHELRGIKRFSEDHSLKHLRQWITDFKLKNDADKQKAVIDILSFTAEEKQLQFTGRKILYPIMSKYTIADKLYYKPWIDQQELLQVFDDLKNCSINGKENWDAYCELLTHVVCKKHLARKHPYETYRIGALIPAPVDRNGNARYYAVTSFVSNGKGIHSYTLEPLDSQSGLPAIKLYRSTAHSKYALDNNATVRNDINPFNPPGYEGAELGKQYEDNFFKDRTIPLWVGYMLNASQEEDFDKKNLLLGKALNCFQNYVQGSIKKKTLVDIVTKHDAELIEITQNLMNESIFNFFDVLHMVKIILKLKKMKSLPEEQANAQFLLSKIDSKNPKYQNLIVELNRTIADEGLQLEGEVSLFLEQLKDHKKAGKLDEMIKLFYEWADQTKELPRDKKNESLIFTGHSMGASSAAKGFVNNLVHAERVPVTRTASLEAAKVGRKENFTKHDDNTVSLRTFDSPATSALDNQSYHAYGLHTELFTWLKTKFSIIHRMEAGDFISQGGEEHLGASTTDEEVKNLAKWSTFEASVSESLVHATTSVIRDTHTAHASQFDWQGKRHSDLVKECTEAKRHLFTQLHLLKEVDGMSLKQNEERKAKIKQIEEQIESIDKLAQKSIGDYSRIWIDPITMKKFDSGEKKSWSTIQGIFQEFGLRSNKVEKIRSMLGVAIRIFFSWVFSLNEIPENHHAGHGDWWKHRDINGVIAVNFEGIVSQR